MINLYQKMAKKGKKVIEKTKYKPTACFWVILTTIIISITTIIAVSIILTGKNSSDLLKHAQTLCTCPNGTPDLICNVPGKIKCRDCDLGYEMKTSSGSTNNHKFCKICDEGFFSHGQVCTAGAYR